MDRDIVTDDAIGICGSSDGGDTRNKKTHIVAVQLWVSGLESQQIGYDIFL